jgi:hypothetical protein
MHPYIPLQINSSVGDIKLTDEILYWYPWIAKLQNKNTWLALSQRWTADGDLPSCPPPGYEYYIVSGDSLMFGLAEKIASHTNGQVVQLTGPVTDPGLSTEHVKYVPYTSDHRRINRMPMSDINKDIKHKASALTNRITQSKAIVFSALSMFLKPSDIVLSLHNAHSHDKNVHYWNMSGNLICDEHILNFKNNWADKTMILPDDDRTEGSYNNPAYTNCALNFTQESYHYSYMIENDKPYIQPGPFLTEKTWKCILSKTAFVPVGQYQSYAWLEQMGLNFDYGPLDLSFDSDPGNLTRLEKIVHLIKSLDQWTATELYEMTRSSCEHNYNHVMNKEFWQQCELFNQPTVDLLTNL